MLYFWKLERKPDFCFAPGGFALKVKNFLDTTVDDTVSMSLPRSW